MDQPVEILAGNVIVRAGFETEDIGLRDAALLRIIHPDIHGYRACLVENQQHIFRRLGVQRGGNQQHQKQCTDYHSSDNIT